jgi:ATP citrate (pro-S)-lyase
MARVKISEYTAKSILIPNYLGVSLTTSNYVSVISSLSRNLLNTNLVIKVDQGIKKRGKQGLVKVNVTAGEIPAIIKEWSALGWSNFLLEPVIEHAQGAEHYLAIERIRDGWQISYSEKGGIDIESNWDFVTRILLKRNARLQVEQGSSADERRILSVKLGGVSLMELISPFIPLLDSHHISFLEMNPVLIRGDKLIPLDMACEVDDTGSPLIPVGAKYFSPAETQIQTLDASTPASLKFKLLNPSGSIWVFLSGGGASLVIADEVADIGLGQELANYGEYSGSPSDDDVYSYAKIILAELLQATINKPRTIIVAGGVANFTDVAKTFRGLIRALDEKKTELVKAKVKVFVRRGGPNEEKGLQMMRDFLTKSNLLGSVHGHDIVLTQVVTEVCDYLGSDLKGRAQPDIKKQTGGKVRP